MKYWNRIGFRGTWGRLFSELSDTAAQIFQGVQLSQEISLTSNRCPFGASAQSLAHLEPVMPSLVDWRCGGCGWCRRPQQVLDLQILSMLISKFSKLSKFQDALQGLGDEGKLAQISIILSSLLLVFRFAPKGCFELQAAWCKILETAGLKSCDPSKGRRLQDIATFQRAACALFLSI